MPASLQILRCRPTSEASFSGSLIGFAALFLSPGRLAGHPICHHPRCAAVYEPRVRNGGKSGRGRRLLGVLQNERNLSHTAFPDTYLYQCEQCPQSSLPVCRVEKPEVERRGSWMALRP